MFFRSKNMAGNHLQATFEMKFDEVPRLHMLPNGFLLSITKLKNDNGTILRLFNPKTKVKVSERFFQACCNVTMLSCSKDHFLLDADNTYILSNEDLMQNTYSDKDVSDLSVNYPITVKSNRVGDDVQIVLIGYDSTGKLKEMSPPVLIKGHDAVRGYYTPGVGEKPIKLDNGQIAFSVLGHNTDYFKVFVFDKNIEGEYAYSLKHIIDPKTWPCNTDSRASGKMVALTKGRLLTYHQSGHHFQVWEGNHCIKEWNWSDIKGIQWVDHLTTCVTSLPDGDHLLMEMGHQKLFMFNIETQQIERVEIGNLDVWGVCVASNGQTIINAVNKTYTQSTLLAVDFTNIADYRKNITILLTQNIGKDMGSIVNGYLGYDEAWVKDESTPQTSRCTIS